MSECGPAQVTLTTAKMSLKFDRRNTHTQTHTQKKNETQCDTGGSGEEYKRKML